MFAEKFYKAFSFWLAILAAIFTLLESNFHLVKGHVPDTWYAYGFASIALVRMFKQNFAGAIKTFSRELKLFFGVSLVAMLALISTGCLTAGERACVASPGTEDLELAQCAAANEGVCPEEQIDDIMDRGDKEAKQCLK